MKHKTWFRLVLKAIGILLIGLSLPELTGVVLWMVRMASFAQSPWTMTTPPGVMPVTGTLGPIIDFLLGLLPQLVQFLFGLYLLLGGRWLADRIIPSNRPYCPECGYDLSRSTNATCPECGIRLPADLRGRAGDATP